MSACQLAHACLFIAISHKAHPYQYLFYYHYVYLASNNQVGSSSWYPHKIMCFRSSRMLHDKILVTRPSQSQLGPGSFRLWVIKSGHFVTNLTPMSTLKCAIYSVSCPRRLLWSKLICSHIFMTWYAGASELDLCVRAYITAVSAC